MKKLLSLVLALLMLTSVSLAIHAEDLEGVNKDNIPNADKLAEELLTKDSEEAFRSWARACTTVIILMKDAAYNCATGIYGYATGEGYSDDEKYVATIKAMMIGEDMWSVTVPVEKNSKENTFTDLNNAVVGYRNLLSYQPLLLKLVALMPEVPTKYSKVSAMIETAQNKLSACADAFTKWANGETSQDTMDLWGVAEPLYWDTSINTLVGIFYMDSQLNE
jgi:hypothetical protein